MALRAGLLVQRRGEIGGEALAGGEDVVFGAPLDLGTVVRPPDLTTLHHPGRLAQLEAGQRFTQGVEAALELRVEKPVAVAANERDVVPRGMVDDSPSANGQGIGVTHLEHESDSILIVGVSARAAAFSARRAGLRPFAIDQFVDEDLTAMCTCLRSDGSPGQIMNMEARLPACPWMYTGGLENQPDLVGRLSAQRTLIGNPPHVIRAVREPTRLSQFLRRKGFAYPQICRRQKRPSEGRWLRKSIRSGGGLQVSEPTAVQEASGADYDSKTSTERQKFQE